MAGRVSHAKTRSVPHAVAKHAIPPLHVLAVLPPPLDGMTHVTTKMIEALTATGPVKLTVAANDSGHRRPRWVLRRHITFFSALIRNIFTGRGRGSCYFVPNSGFGLWLNLLEAPLLRVGYREVWLHHHVFSHIRRRDRRMAVFLAILGSKARHIVLCEAMAAGLRETYRTESIYMLGNAALATDMWAMHPKTTLKTCGFLGNITRAKGIGLFMETIRTLEARGREIRAHIAGPVIDSELRTEIDAFVAEAPERHVALGPVQGESKRVFFEGIDLLLFPSIYTHEALPVTIYEGLAAAMPVLATQRGCIPNQLEGSGWAVPEESFVADAAAKIEVWMDNAEAFAAAAQEARARFKAHHCIDSQRLGTLIREMTKQ
jgi:glycosyltransferase involved in cell wall biosynthesis